MQSVRIPIVSLNARRSGIKCYINPGIAFLSQKREDLRERRYVFRNFVTC